MIYELFAIFVSVLYHNNNANIGIIIPKFQIKMGEFSTKQESILLRVEKIAQNEGVTIGAVERKIGASKGVLSRAIAKGTDIQSKWLQSVVENYPSYSAEWLLTGKGDMIKRPDGQQAGLKIQEKFSLKSDHFVDLQRVPLYNLEATAGLVALFEDVKTVPLSYISLPDLPACDGAVYVRGDSMYPLLKSGDIVLYKQVHDMKYGIFWGEMYLISFNIDGEEFITIKYIQKSEQEDCIKLVSHNPHHNPTDIPRCMIRALAIIKASVRYNTIR